MTSLQSDYQQLFSRERQVRFLEALSVTGNVRSACRHVAIAPPTAYRARRGCGHFARAWEAAMVCARTAAEEVLADRALNGVEESVFYHGEEVATRRRYDARLLLAHLARLDAKALDPLAASDAAGFNAVMEHFERTGELPAPEIEAEPDAAANANAPGGAGDELADPDAPWNDESLPLVERALLFLERDDGDYDASDEEADEGFDQEYFERNWGGAAAAHFGPL